MDPLIDVLTRRIKPKAETFSAMSIVSMDHSPSEQLSDANWYTTVIIVSPTTEHADLASEIATILRPKEKELVKWTRASKNYKRNFLNTLTNSLKNNPSCIFAISANKEAILQLLPEILRQTGLGSLYKPALIEGKTKIRFGPYYNKEGEQHITISENRAIMAFFIAHFFLRIYHGIRIATSRNIGWSVFMDKFPGDIGGDMATLFSCIIDLIPREGSIMRGSLLESDTHRTDLLADNIAGLLSGMVQKDRDIPPLPDRNGFIYWEKYQVS